MSERSKPDREKLEETQVSSTESPALQVIAAFGGIRPMAQKLGLAVSTVQGWKERATIPPARHDDILDGAARAGVELPEALLTAAGQPPEPSSDEAPKTSEKTSEVKQEAPAAKPAQQSIASRVASGEKAAAQKGETSPPLPPRRQEAGRKNSASLRWAVAGMVVCLLLMGAGFGGALALRDIWLPWVQAPAQEDPRLVALEQSLASLDDQIRALNDQNASLRQALNNLPEAAPVDLSSLESRLAGLESELSLLSGELARASGLSPADLEKVTGAQAALESRLSDLSRGLENLSAEMAARPALVSAPQADLAALLAAFQLRDALTRGAPHDALLESLAPLWQDDPQAQEDLQRLRDFGGQGVPGRGLLLAAYPAMAQAVVRAERGSEVGKGWWSNALDKLLGLIPLRPVGLREGASATDRVARAEVQLREGSLVAAIRTLESLEGKPAQEASAWLEEARARAAAERILDRVSAMIGAAGVAGGAG